MCPSLPASIADLEDTRQRGSACTVINVHHTCLHSTTGLAIYILFIILYIRQHGGACCLCRDGGGCLHAVIHNNIIIIIIIYIYTCTEFIR